MNKTILALSKKQMQYIKNSENKQILKFFNSIDIREYTMLQDYEKYYVDTFNEQYRIISYLNGIMYRGTIEDEIWNDLWSDLWNK
jgi:hypothetical protein